MKVVAGFSQSVSIIYSLFFWLIHSVQTVVFLSHLRSGNKIICHSSRNLKSPQEQRRKLCFASWLGLYSCWLFIPQDSGGHSSVLSPECEIYWALASQGLGSDLSQSREEIKISLLFNILTLDRQETAVAGGHHNLPLVIIFIFIYRRDTNNTFRKSVFLPTRISLFCVGSSPSPSTTNNGKTQNKIRATICLGRPDKLLVVRLWGHVFYISIPESVSRLQVLVIHHRSITGW